MNYLYNGVLMPDINTVWKDKETYPYAFVTDSMNLFGERFVELILHSKQADVVMLAANAMITDTNVPIVIYRLSEDGKSLQLYSETDTGGIGFICNASGVAWSNYDIYYAEDYFDEALAGTLYLAATTPISLANQTVIEWDGVTEGVEAFSYTVPGQDTAYTYYKVADVAPTKAQLNAGWTVWTYRITSTGSTKNDGGNPLDCTFEDGDIYGCEAWLVKDGGLWLKRFETGLEGQEELDVWWVSLMTFATANAAVKAQSFLSGYLMGCKAREMLRKKA